jgi:cupin superfamily acireductone dioxygenase involved in methionine salvage
MMTKQDVNHIYEESVYQIRLRVAMSLLAVPGINHDRALEEADKFVLRLMDEDADWLMNHFKGS